MASLIVNQPSTAASPIRLKSVALHHVRIPLVEPFRISNGVVSEKEAILVEVKTREGVIGWGEASPMSGSFYSDDTPESTWRALTTHLVPLVLGAEAFAPNRLYERLRHVPVDAFAKAGLEGAIWDACAWTLRAPLCELFGGLAKPIPSGVAIGIYDDVSDLLKRVNRYIAEGYRRLKIKIQPGWDVLPVAAVRTHFPDVPLMVDANAAYTIEDLSVFRELDSYGLMMIEQPLGRHEYEEAGELQRQLNTPLCADESAESLETLSSLISKRAARIINIKVQRVGGLSEAKQMLASARSAGLECWVGTMPELGVASAQGLQLAMLDGFRYPTDIEASSRWYVDDVIEPAIEIDARGLIQPPAGPGAGYRISSEKLERYTIAHEEFTC